MKKIFIISSIVLLSLLILWGVYSVFFKTDPYSGEVATETKTVAQDAPKPVTEDIGMSIFSGGPIKQVMDEAVVGAVFDPDGKTLWFVTTQPAAVKKVDILSGAESTLLELKYTPMFVRWSPDRTKVLLEERALGSERWHMVDMLAKTDTVLKDGLMTPVWTNTGDRIAYEYDGGGNRSIDMADPDGKNWKTITTVPFTAPVVLEAIPQSSMLAVWNLPGAFYETSLRTVSLAGGELKTIFTRHFGTDYLFSPKGDTVAISSSDEKGGGKLLLGLSNVTGGEYRTLGIPTLVGKVVWSADGKKLYYALPGDFPPSVVLPDDYRGKPVLTQDTFWSVDIASGEKTRLVDLVDLTGSYDASSLFLDPQERYLFFINRQDSRLYRIKF